MMVKKKSTTTAVQAIENLQSSSILPLQTEVTPSELSTIQAACKKIGMGLSDYLEAIQRGLKATRTTVDKYGDEHTEDDTMAQLKAAVMGLEVEGYIKAKGSVTEQSMNQYNTVVYQWKKSSIPTAAIDR